MTTTTRRKSVGNSDQPDDEVDEAENAQRRAAALERARADASPRGNLIVRFAVDYPRSWDDGLQQSAVPKTSGDVGADGTRTEGLAAALQRVLEAREEWRPCEIDRCGTGVAGVAGSGGCENDDDDDEDKDDDDDDDDDDGGGGDDDTSSSDDNDDDTNTHGQRPAAGSRSTSDAARAGVDVEAQQFERWHVDPSNTHPFPGAEGGGLDGEEREARKGGRDQGGGGKSGSGGGGGGSKGGMASFWSGVFGGRGGKPKARL